MIGNLLDSRKTHVIMIDRKSSNSEDIQLTSEDLANGIEIESKIVENLKSRHDHYYANHKTG